MKPLNKIGPYKITDQLGAKLDAALLQLPTLGPTSEWTGKVGSVTG